MAASSSVPRRRACSLRKGQGWRKVVMAGKGGEGGVLRGAPPPRLLVVGPGVLGQRLIQQWLEAEGGGGGGGGKASVVAQSNTERSHEALRALGAIPRVKPKTDGEGGAGREVEEKCLFPYVVFCAPPSGSEDYVAEVKRAAGLWNGEGMLLFTSSTGVYEAEEGVCVESSPTKPRGESPRIDRLLDAEAAVLDVGGCVVRLAGLYHRTRGAHSYYAKAEEVGAAGNALLNLIHYDDAASICRAALLRGQPGRVYVGSDGSPISRDDMMAATLNAGVEERTCTFAGEREGVPLGKTFDASKSGQDLGWTPRFTSFASFMEAVKVNAQLV